MKLKLIYKFIGENHTECHIYIDAVVKGDTKAQEAHIAKCKEVKEKYPK